MPSPILELLGPVLTRLLTGAPSCASDALEPERDGADGEEQERGDRAGIALIVAAVVMAIAVLMAATALWRLINS